MDLTKILTDHAEWTASDVDRGSRANLRGADLRDANLHSANLRGADLRSADLRDANLHSANLRGADLRGANLHSADLRGANLHSANLRGANLHSANLRGANLHSANLRGADLRGADLRDADLSDAIMDVANLSRRGALLTDADVVPYRTDVLEILDLYPDEVHGVRAALVEGRVDGSVYSGECACLVGTIAKVRGCDVYGLPTDSQRPAEIWFYAIRPGHTPETSGRVAETVGWIDEWLAGRLAQCADTSDTPSS